MAADGAESHETRNLSIKVSLIVMALLAAGYFAFFRGGEDLEQIDTPDSAEPYYCDKCKKGFELTPAGFQRLSEEGGVRSANDRAGRLVFCCPHCGEFAGASACRCPQDGTIFPVKTSDGSPPRCPKCNWTP